VSTTPASVPPAGGPPLLDEQPAPPYAAEAVRVQTPAKRKWTRRFTTAASFCLFESRFIALKDKPFPGSPERVSLAASKRRSVRREPASG
jgi:hypothetical protein